MQEAMNPAQVNDLNRLFGRFFSKEKALVEYPVRSDYDGEYLFTERFDVGSIHEGRVYGAWLIEVDAPGNDFTPFQDDGTGVTVAEWTPERAWDFHPATD